MEGLKLNKTTEKVNFYFSWGYYYYSASNFSCKKSYEFSLVTN